MSTKSTIRKSIAVAALALAVPAVAGAQPIKDDEPDVPNNPAPVAKLTVSPNPALFEQQLVVAQARAVPGPVGGFHSGDLVTFDGSASTDDSGIVKYEFDLDGNGTYEVSGTQAKTSRRYAQTGTYTIKLRVTDDGNKSKVVTKTLIVHAPPKPKLTASRDVALVGQSVDLDPSGSTDDNGIGKYELDLDGDGVFEIAKTTGEAVSTSYTTIGERTVSLRVTDVYGVARTTAVKIAVHRAPTAAFTFAPGVAGQAVTFDASTSGDDGSIARYEWDLDGDGTFETDTKTASTVTKTFAAPGTFTVRLRVTDDHGVQDAVAHDVTIAPKPAQPTTTGSTVTTAADTSAPLVRVLTGAAKLHRTGNVLVKVSCPAGETACTGRLVLKAKGRKLGAKAFALTGGQTSIVKVALNKKARKAVKQSRRLSARAIATATDAAGNKGTTRKALLIKR